MAGNVTDLGLLVKTEIQELLFGLLHQSVLLASKIHLCHKYSSIPVGFTVDDALGQYGLFVPVRMKSCAVMGRKSCSVPVDVEVACNLGIAIPFLSTTTSSFFKCISLASSISGCGGGERSDNLSLIGVWLIPVAICHHKASAFKSTVPSQCTTSDLNSNSRSCQRASLAVESVRLKIHLRASWPVQTVSW